MKTKLKHLFFLAALCFAAMACGSNLAKPASGLDVSSLPTSLLSISPSKTPSEEAGQILEQNEQPLTNSLSIHN